MTLHVGQSRLPAVPSQGNGGALRAQLAEATRQLGDCLTCATARTPEGQARIQRLTARVQALRSRLDQVAAQSTRSAERPEEPLRAATVPGPPASGSGGPGDGDTQGSGVDAGRTPRLDLQA